MSDVQWLREMILADLFRQFPQTMPLFLAHGMACVGCDLNGLVTVAEAIAVYKLEPERFLEELAHQVQAQSSMPAIGRRPEEKR